MILLAGCGGSGGRLPVLEQVTSSGDANQGVELALEREVRTGDHVQGIHAADAVAVLLEQPVPAESVLTQDSVDLLFDAGPFGVGDPTFEPGPGEADSEVFSVAW
ncbi:hypothetical protein [Pseudonocardia sp. HH130630-07]|uniref:hypothetical protein n=1 Tax=Pseudonocardia sp. HH130630-07 TaxID=1690815 RepID=UPI0012EAF207|nr:hypothetical protein [Pseudonocardia sp. HH130630-07]